MQLKDIETRITHIEENIKASTAQVQHFTKSLQDASQQVFTLNGHLNECQFWKMKCQDDLQLQSESEMDDLEEQILGVVEEEY